LATAEPATCTVCFRPLNPFKVYLGRADEEDDLGSRCFVMKKVIEAAENDGSIDKDATRSAAILKVFMAPEFYFRGRQGAYSLPQIESIIEQMGEETKKPKYKDWLFIYGTAIGYHKHERTDAPSELETPLRITQVIKGTRTTVHVAK